MMGALYEAIDVWRRLSPARVVRYRCFRNVSSGRYSVQSADFYNNPLDSQQAARMERQYMELMAEQAPDERADSFESVEAAIEAHERDFSE
jgi:hypothetical protein